MRSIRRSRAPRTRAIVVFEIHADAGGHYRPSRFVGVAPARLGGLILPGNHRAVRVDQRELAGDEHVEPLHRLLGADLDGVVRLLVIQPFARQVAVDGLQEREIAGEGKRVGRGDPRIDVGLRVGERGGHGAVTRGGALHDSVDFG